MNIEKFMKRCIVVLAIVMVFYFSFAFATESSAAAKVTVKKTGTKLQEGKKLTKSMVRKVLKVYKNGKKTTKYKCTQVGKTIKYAKKGFKLTIKTGKASKSVYVPVKKKTATYTVTVGTVNGNGAMILINGIVQQSATFKAGENVSLVVVDVPESLVFANWIDSTGKVISTNKYYNFNVESDTTVLAVFQPKVIQDDEAIISAVSQDQLGTVGFVGESASETAVTKTAKIGTEVELVATPKNGYTFFAWQDAQGYILETSKVLKFTVKQSQIVFAVFTEDTNSGNSNGGNNGGGNNGGGQTSAKEEVSVKLTRSGEGIVEFNNSTCSFVNNTVTNKVNKGSSCTVTAYNTSTYRFSKWINSTTKETLSTFSSYTFTADSDKKVTAVFEKIYTVTVNRSGGRGKVTVNGNELEFYNNVATTRLAAGSATVHCESSQDYEFVSLEKSGSMYPIVSAPTNSANVTVTDNITLTANYAEVNKTVTVAFKYTDGTILQSSSVNFGEAPTTPVASVSGNLNDSTFKGWTLNGVNYLGNLTDVEFYSGSSSLSDAIKAKTTAKQNVVIYAYYEQDMVYYNLTISGAESVTDENGVPLNPASILANTHVYIVAETVTGKNFAGWQNSNGSIESQRASYDFYMNADVVLTATYSDIPVPKTPKVAFRGSKYSDSRSEGKITFFTTIDVSGTECPLVQEWGILCTFYDLSDFTIDTENCYTITDNSGVKNSPYADSSVFWSGFYDEDWTNHCTVKCRVYAKVANAAGETQTIYSDVLSVTLHE